jgi:hypothetical protein
MVFTKERNRNVEEKLNKARRSRICSPVLSSESSTGSTNDNASMSASELESEPITEEINKCENCHKTSIPVTVVAKGDMHYRQKWASGVCLLFHDKDTVDEAPLCDGCLQYAIDAKSRNNDGSIVWQCFVYKVLKDHIKRMQLWMIMPQQLREWWIEYARNLPGMNDVSVDYPEVMV